MKKIIIFLSIAVLTIAMIACGGSSGSSSGTAGFTVTFDSQGADTPATPATMTVTDPATTIDALPTDPVKTDYQFYGWYTEVDGGGDQFDADTEVTADITVYAYLVPMTSSYGNNLAVSPNGIPYTLTADYNTVNSIKKWNSAATSFVILTAAGMPTKCDYGAAIAVDADETVYLVANPETPADSGIVLASVYKLTNGAASWTLVGNAGFATGGTSLGNSCKIVIDNAKKVYVMAADENNDMKVYYLDGGSWTTSAFPDESGDAGVNGTYNKSDIAVDGTNVYFASTSKSVTCVKVYKFNGSSWTRVGADTDLTSNDQSTYPVISADSDYIAIVYKNTSNNLEIAQYDGTWSNLSGFTSYTITQGTTSYMTIQASGSDIYFGCDGSVQSYNGSTWDTDFAELTNNLIDYSGLYSGLYDSKLYFFVGSPITGEPYLKLIDLSI